MADAIAYQPNVVASAITEQPAEPLADEFRRANLAGHKLAVQCRLIAALVVMVLMLFMIPDPEGFSGQSRLIFYEICAIVLSLNAVVSYAINRSRFNGPWRAYLFVGLDFVFVTLAVIGPAFIFDDGMPGQMLLRYNSFLYYFIFVALIALGYSPALMLWAGFSAALTYSVGVIFVLMKPDTLFIPASAITDIDAMVAMLNHPHVVDINVRIQEVVVMLLVAGILAAVARRSRRLIVRQADLARQRTNLARYFSPRLVNELAGRDQPIGPVRRQDVGVLFADIVGFTRFAESARPEQVMDLLRDFHGRMEAEVFNHDGTMEKFIGDALLATFGVPDSTPNDAAQAVRCARAMLERLRQWNAERAGAGDDPIHIGIGVHFGPAVLGDIGSARNMAFSVVGDTTNVASRLQQLTRDLNCAAVFSDDVVRRVRAQDDAATTSLLAGVRHVPPQSVKGREQPIDIWVLDG